MNASGKKKIVPLQETQEAFSVEVVDAADRPLVRMPLESALRQRLNFRVAALALYDRAGTLFLRRRPAHCLPHAGLWDLYAAPVPAGQARKDAALALLDQGATATVASLRKTRLRPPDAAQIFFLTLYAATLPHGVQPHGAGTDALLPLDRDELRGLTAHVPELFTPLVLLAAREGMLFS